MSASVKLSLRASREVLEFLDRCPEVALDHPNRGMEELRAAIAKAERSTATRRQLAKPKAEKRATAKARRFGLRALVLARAKDCCEWCGGKALTAQTQFRPLEVDHFFGRAKADEEMATCWALCSSCHRSKTDNNPTSAEWLQRFMSHAINHGYMPELERARSRLAFVQARGAT